MKSYQQFFAELKRRKVFKVAAVYGAGAFVILQAADVLGQGLLLPESFLPFITAIVLLGFPLALILAWAFEVTPEGVQRTGAAAAGEIEGIMHAPASQRWPAGLMALAGVAALVLGAWWVGRQTASETSPDSVLAPAEARLAFAEPSTDTRPSIAVLPFADMSPDQDQEYFGDGMTEEILNTLARVRDLRVSGRTSTFAYKGRDKDLREIGAELGVSYLVEGSVRKAGNQLRITAQLIDAANGAHLWSDQYDRSMDDVFAIQTEIAEAIAAELRVPLGLDAGETLVTPTADLEAYDLYLAGRSRMRERGPSLLEAVDLFEAAIARDSSWAPAWAGLAEASELRLWHSPARPAGMTRQEFNPIGLAASERAARRALELDPDNASALVALGSVQRNQAEWEAAETTYLRALATDPDNAEAYHQYGDLLLNVGRIGEGVRLIDRAAALDRAPIRFEMLGFGLEVDNQQNESVEAFEMAVSRQMTTAGHRRSLNWLAESYLVAGRWQDASQTWKEANRLDPKAARIMGSDDEIDAYVNGLAQADLSLIPVTMHDSVSTFGWIRLGNLDRAITKLLNTAAGQPFGRAIEFRYPVFEPLRSDPRVQEFLAERGLAGVEEIRTPEAERTRPLALREAGE